MKNRLIRQMNVYCSEKEHKIKLDISNYVISNTKNRSNRMYLWAFC